MSEFWAQVLAALLLFSAIKCLAFGWLDIGRKPVTMSEEKTDDGYFFKV